MGVGLGDTFGEGDKWGDLAGVRGVGFLVNRVNLFEMFLLY
jgi:hypothetical protein